MLAHPETFPGKMPSTFLQDCTVPDRQGRQGSDRVQPRACPRVSADRLRIPHAGARGLQQRQSRRRGNLL